MIEKNVVYKLVGMQEGFSCKSSFLFRKSNSDLEITCPVGVVSTFYNLISKEDIVYIEEIKNFLLSDNSRT